MIVAARLAYDGTDFAGWQQQVEARTVQGDLQAALGRLYQRDIKVAGAGRTDAGVHARGQVVAFATPGNIPAERVREAVNRELPETVAIRTSWAASETFDPRRDAVARVYRYTLAEDDAREPLRDRYATRVRPGLDRDAMVAASVRLMGGHDFGSFCCENGYEGSTCRTLRRLDWDADRERWTLELEGDSFLYKQVRCIMGVLLAIGRGRYDVGLVERMLSGEPRPVAVAVAPPTGLVLERVIYPAGVRAE